MAFTQPCKRCGLEWTLHSDWDKDVGICTKHLYGIGSHDEPKSAHVIVNESNEATVNAVEETLQSLLVIVRSIGLDPAQFLQRAIERANREAKTLSANEKFRDRFAGFVVEAEHGRDQGKSPRITEAAKRAGNSFLHSNDPHESVLSNDRVRNQVETADAIERSNEGKNQVPDMRWYEAWDAVEKERKDKGD